MISMEKMEKKAAELGCSVALAKLIYGLEKKVDDLIKEVGVSEDPNTISYRLKRLEDF